MLNSRTIPGYDSETNEVYVGSGFKLTNIHLPAQCEGRICMIHNIPNYMHTNNIVWRRGQAETICKHGQGHWHAAQFEFWNQSGQSWRSIHGCLDVCDDYCHGYKIIPGELVNKSLEIES